MMSRDGRYRIKTDCPKCGKLNAIVTDITIYRSKNRLEAEFHSKKCYKCGFRFRDRPDPPGPRRERWTPPTSGPSSS